MKPPVATQPAEPVEPQPAAVPAPPESAVTGGPGLPATPPPARRPVKLAGREFEVDPELAEALAQRERDYEAGIQRQGQELGELRARAREYEIQQERLRSAIVPESRQPAEPEIDTLLFTDPKKALDLHEQRVLARINAQQQTERDREGFWTQFYQGQPDLQRGDDHWLVEAILQRHFRDLAHLTVDEGHKKLGDLTRQAMLKILQKKGGSAAAGSPRTVVEGGSHRPERAAAPAPDEGPKSLSDVIQARRAARRAPRPAASR